MITEIITIGDELITGHTVDTNAAFIGRHLTDLGFAVKYRTSIGDSLESMDEAFRLAGDDGLQLLGRQRVVLGHVLQF